MVEDETGYGSLSSGWGNPLKLEADLLHSRQNDRRPDSEQFVRCCQVPFVPELLSLWDLKGDRGLAGCTRSVPWQQDEGSRCGILRHQEGNQPLSICGTSSSIANDRLIERNGCSAILQAHVIRWEGVETFSARIIN